MTTSPPQLKRLQHVATWLDLNAITIFLTILWLVVFIVTGLAFRPDIYAPAWASFMVLRALNCGTQGMACMPPGSRPNKVKHAASVAPQSLNSMGPTRNGTHARISALVGGGVVDDNKSAVSQ